MVKFRSYKNKKFRFIKNFKKLIQKKTSWNSTHINNYFTPRNLFSKIKQISKYIISLPLKLISNFFKFTPSFIEKDTEDKKTPTTSTYFTQIVYSSDILRIIGEYISIADILSFRSVSKEYFEIVRCIYYNILQEKLRVCNLYTGKLNEQVVYRPNPNCKEMMGLFIIAWRFSDFLAPKNKNYIPDPNYLEIQNAERLTSDYRTRCNVVDWILELCHELHISLEVSVSSVKLMDRVLSIIVLPR